MNIGKGVFMADGTQVVADSVRIRDLSDVFRVLGNNLAISPTAVVRGGTGPASFPLVNQFCSLEPIACGGPDVRVLSLESGGPLAPGSYGNVLVGNSGTLTLQSGTYNMCRLQVGREGTIQAQAPTTLNVEGIVRIGNGASLLSSSPASPIVLNSTGKLVRVGQFGVVQAFITAPNAQLRLGRSALFQGTFCVDALRNDKSIRLECPCPQ
jgi:hypothetical protein